MGVKAKNSIDLTKLIMAVFVVAIHTNPLAGVQNQTVLTVCNTVLQMAVPFFFLASGYLLGIHIRDLRCPEESIPVVKRQLKKILGMYLIHMYVWTFYYLAVYGQKQFGVDSFAVTVSVSLGLCLLYTLWKQRRNRNL